MPTMETFPDYELEDLVVAERPEALKALGDRTRTMILSLLMERAATTTHLARALDKPKGTVGYHLKVLEDAGLVRVVRTRRVRAMIEKYYGRTGRTIVYGGQGNDPKPRMLQEAIDEARAGAADDPLPLFTIRRARIPQERAAEFADRLVELAVEFTEVPRGGNTVFGLVAGVYPTDHPVLDPDDADLEAGGDG
jgi:DNA-binding transcriptional ArsR family regulator